MFTKVKPKLNLLFVIGTIIFFIDLLVLGVYLYFFRAGIYSQGAVFWICSLVALFIIIIGTLWFSRKLQVYIILLAIVLFIWLLKSVYIPASVPLFGSDPYITLSATNNIAETGWFNNPPWNENLDIISAQDRNYPFLSGIVIGLSALTGIGLEMLARWVNVTLSLISIGLVFGISYQLFQSEKTAVLSSLGFGLTYYFLMFHSLFVREALAFTFFLAILYTFVEQEKSSGAVSRIIPFLLVIGLVLSHHLTALMLVLFILVSLFLKLFFPRKVKPVNQDKRLIEWPFLGFLAVAMLTYWVFLRYTPIQIVNVMISNAFSESTTINLSNAIPQTPRYIATLILQVSSASIFGILAVIGLIKFKTKNYSWQVLSVLWGGTLGLIALVGTTGALGALGSFPARMEIYGYVFLIPAACHTITSIYKKLPWAGYLLGVLVLILHSSSTLLRTGPYLYSDEKPNVLAGESRAILLDQEYQLISRIDPKKNGLVGSSFRGPIKLFDLNATIPDYSNLHLNGYDYLLLTELDVRMLQIVSNKPGFETLDKIYDSGSAVLYIPVIKDFTNLDSILRHSSVIPAQKTNIWNWVLGMAILLSCFFIGFLLVDSLGFGIGYGQGFSPLGKQALGFCTGLFLLFLGFLFYDITDHFTPLLIVFPLFSAIVFVAIAQVRRRNSFYRFSRFSSSWFFLSIIVIVGVGSFLFEFASERSVKDPYTEFYISNVSQSRLTGTIGVVNRGFKGRSYQVEGKLGDRLFFVKQFTLSPQEQWEGVYSLNLKNPLPASNREPLQFSLLGVSGDENKQELYVWP